MELEKPVHLVAGDGTVDHVMNAPSRERQDALQRALEHHLFDRILDRWKRNTLRQSRELHQAIIPPARKARCG